MFFISYFNALHHAILNHIRVAKINLQWSCLPAFPTLPCKPFKLERALTEKLKCKHLDRVFEMFYFFEILKICVVLCL